MKKTVAIFTTTQGHQSIAEAAREALADDYQVEVFFHQDISFELYILLYKHAPGLFTGPFAFGAQPQMTWAAKQLYAQRYAKKLKDFMVDTDPDLLINTFWMYQTPLETYSQETGVPLLNILADPWTIHPVEIATPPFCNLSFDQKTADYCHQYSAESVCIPTGWFVRDAFTPPADLTQTRTSLSLDPKLLTLLCVAGSEGTESILDLVKALKVEHPVQIVVACGKNEALYEKVNQLALKQPDSQVKLIPLGFTKEIYRYMQAADLVIGKAGPNMLFETLATETPFMATTHIHGQEDGNLDIIQEYGLGYVEERTEEAIKLLEKIIDHPTQLEAFAPQVKKMAQYNKQAKAKLRELVAAQLHS